MIDPTSIVPIVGANGAVAAVLGAYAIRFPKSEILISDPSDSILMPYSGFKVPAAVFLTWWFLQQLSYDAINLGVMANLGSHGTTYWANVGGFIFGMILGPFIGLFQHVE